LAKEVILKKLKFQLGAHEDSLSFLDNLKKDELDALFLQTAKAINGGQTDLWQKLAKGSHLMPAFIAAKLSENIFGEAICANVASYMKIKDALRITNHLSVEFMAKVTPHLIPEKNEELINAIPLRKNRKVTRILLEEKDYYTVARFVDTLEMSKVIEIADKEVKDELVLLHIASFVENKAVVARIFMNFSEGRRLKLIQTAYENDFRDELMKAMAHLSQDNINHLLSIIVELPFSVREQVTDDLNNT